MKLTLTISNVIPTSVDKSHFIYITIILNSIFNNITNANSTAIKYKLYNCMLFFLHTKEIIILYIYIKVLYNYITNFKKNPPFYL